MTSTIAVGVDGSPDSGVALDWAAAEARLRGGRLLVVYGLFMPMAVVPFGGAAILPPSDDLRAYAQDVLDRARQRVTDQAPDVAVETFLILRRPVDAILEVARDASLIVVGTRGLSAFGALALGSVSGRVAAHSTCPTVVVPPSTTPNDGSIVVGVDGSAHSDAALRFALVEAARRSAKVVAVHAYHAGTIPMPIFDPDIIDKATAEEHSRAEALVEGAVARAVRATGSDITVTSHTQASHPADALVDAG